MADEYEVQDSFDTEVARKYFALFQSELGQEVLAHLRKISVEKPTMPQSASDGHSLAMLMSLREGENNIVRQIERFVKNGERKERNG